MRQFIVFLICALLSINIFALQPVTVLLDWFINPDHAPLFIAQEKGYFAAQGLKVTLIGPADSADPPKLVAAGKADIAITYQPRFLQQVDHQLPLVMIGNLINHPLNCLVADKSIQTLAQLMHKKIGFSGGNLSHISLKVMFEKNGLDLKNVELLNIHYALTQSLLTHKVDAVTGMMRNFEAIQLQQLGMQATLFYPENYGMPTYSELIFVANKSLKSNAMLQHFLYAVKLGVAYVKAHPAASWQLFATKHPELNNPLNHAAWLQTSSLFADDPASIEQKNFMAYAQFMQQNGLIQSVQPAANYFKDAHA